MITTGQIATTWVDLLSWKDLSILWPRVILSGEKILIKDWSSFSEQAKKYDCTIEWAWRVSRMIPKKETETWKSTNDLIKIYGNEFCGWWGKGIITTSENGKETYWNNTVTTDNLPTNIQNWVAFIQNYNVWVKSWSQLIQLTKNGWSTKVCNNWQPLEYLDPQMQDEFLVTVVRCKWESSAAYMRNTKQWWSYKLQDTDWIKFEKLENEKYGIEHPRWWYVITKKQIEEWYKVMLEKTKKAQPIKIDSNWDILFQEYKWDRYDLPLQWFWPLYVDKSFAPDNIPWKVQKFKINDKIFIYMKIGNQYKSYDWMREFSFNLGINQNWKEQFTEPTTGVFNRVWWMWQADQFQYILTKDTMIIIHDSFPSFGAIYIYNLITQKRYYESDILKTITKLESKKSKDIMCTLYYEKRWEDIIINIYKAKSECGAIEWLIWDIYQTINYKRNSITNWFEFLWSQILDDYYEYKNYKDTDPKREMKHIVKWVEVPE